MKYILNLLTISALSLSTLVVNAQDSIPSTRKDSVAPGIAAHPATGHITGTIVDGSSKVVESATIKLLRAGDSTLVKIAVAGKSGEFTFPDLPFGSYMVAVSAIGHEAGLSETAIVNEANPQVTLRTIELIPVTKSMGGVTVSARKPFIEQKPGKMVINVESSPVNAGLNALELLEKSPGVTVDNDGNISLKGKQGVLVLVDGKPTYMSGADLAALLKNLQASGIDQIEVMTNPPAKYDAAGNSGIINIKTKKGVVKGMNGSVNGGYTQGHYAQFNGGVNVNYRNNKWNLFGGYNGGDWKSYGTLKLNRVLYEADKVTVARTVDQSTDRKNSGTYHNAKLGFDYYFDKKNVIGIVANGNFNDNSEEPMTNSSIRNVDQSLITHLLSGGRNNRNGNNVSTNLNFKHSFDSTGRELTADLDYANYHSINHSDLDTRSFDASGQEVGTAVMLRGLLPQDINIYSAKVDYVHPLKKGWKLESGLKSSLVNTDNTVNYLRNSGSDWVPDDRSNHFVYKENINAGYLIASGAMKKWELSAGLRLENTVARGHQLSNDSSFRRDYTNLFPNAGVSYNMNDKNQFNLSYSRRVQRPDYDDLNPFVFFLDSLTYGKGNPYLQPQFTNNIEFSHTYHHILTTTLNYTRTDQVITELLKQDAAHNITYQTKENFSQMIQYGVSVMANITIVKWWNANAYVNAYYNSYDGVYQQDPITINYTSFTGNMTNSFTLGKGWNAEVSGWYRSKGLEGILVSKAMGALNTGLSKQVFQKKGTVKLGLRDVFHTQQFSGYARYSDVNVTIANVRDSRQVNLSFVYRFGKSNIAPERRRNGGANDEQGRVK